MKGKVKVQEKKNVYTQKNKLKDEDFRMLIVEDGGKRFTSVNYFIF